MDSMRRFQKSSLSNMGEMSDNDMNEGNALQFDNLLQLRSNVDHRHSMMGNRNLSATNGTTQGNFKMCLEHLKARNMNCVECQLTICELCSDENKHADHNVFKQRDLMNCIEQRMEALMSTF